MRTYRPHDLYGRPLAGTDAAHVKEGFLILREYPAADLVQSWQEFLTGADYATHVTSPGYLNEPFMQDKYPFAVLALHADRIVGVLTGVHNGRQIVCGLPGTPQVALSRGGDRLVEQRLAEGLLEASRNAQTITVFGWTSLDAFAEFGFRSRRLAGVAMVDLSLGAEAATRAFPKRRQTYIRKAMKLGVEVYESTSWEEYVEYYDVYVEWSKRKGLPFRSADTLQQSFQQRSNRHLFVARHEGKLIAGLIVRVYPGGVVEFTANHSRPEFLRLRPNDLLHWRVIEWAGSEGYTWYKLGAASYVRRSFQAEIVPTYRVRIDRTFLKRYDRGEVLANGVRRLASRFRNRGPRAVGTADPDE